MIVRWAAGSGGPLTTEVNSTCGNRLAVWRVVEARRRRPWLVVFFFDLEHPFPRRHVKQITRLSVTMN